MKKSSIFLAALMALTMSACQEVPDDVKSRAEEQQGITSSATSGNDTSPSSAAEKIGNITFDCEPDSIETDEFYILRSPKLLDSTNEENYGALKEKLKKVAKSLIDYDIPDDEIAVTESYVLNNDGTPTDRKRGATIDFWNDDAVARIFESSDTFQFWCNVTVRGDPFEFSERTVYTPDDYPDTVFDMNDGSKMTIKQAIEQADDIEKKSMRMTYLMKMLQWNCTG